MFHKTDEDAKSNERRDFCSSTDLPNNSLKYVNY